MARAESLGIKNLTIITADMNDFERRRRGSTTASSPSRCSST